MPSSRRPRVGHSPFDPLVDRERNHGLSGMELAARLRRETTLTMREIARRLHLGSWKSANTRPHSLKQKREQQGAQPLL